MKKLMPMLFLLIALVTPRLAFANPLTDHISATLLDHVSMSALVQDGEMDVALLDSVIQIGSYDGSYLLGLQAGFAGEAAPEPGEATGANYLVGATLRLNPLLRNRVHFPEHWEFLRALEYGIGYHHNLRDSSERFSLVIGLAFDPAPKQ